MTLFIIERILLQIYELFLIICIITGKSCIFASQINNNYSLKLLKL